MSTVLVIGGYGNAGAEITRLLLAHSDHHILVGGRSRERGLAFVDEVRAGATADATSRVEAVTLDATDHPSVEAALDGVDLCLVAAGTSTSGATVDAALARGVDHLDIQVGGSKAARILALDARARAAGVTLVTDGGFHPGVPAAMVRHADRLLGGLERAAVGSVIAVDWGSLRPLAESTVAEMMEEFREFAYEEFRGGRWVTARRQPTFTFPPPFGRRTASAMGLAEMRQLTSALPGLREAGFYVGGFNPVVDYTVIPLAVVGMRVAPDRLAAPLGRLLHWGLVRFSKPPYGTLLQLVGNEPGRPARVLMRLGHPDAYTVTAAPTVATALQLLDGTGRSPGAHTQAMLVETTRFFDDQARMGLDIDWFGG